MSTDSTLSTTNSTAKRLREYTNEEVWTLLESRERNVHQTNETGTGQIVNPPWWSYVLTNGVFYFCINGGNENNSIPASLDLPLKDYELLTLEIWDYREMSDEMKGAEGPSNTSFKMPDGSDFFINLQFHAWPHKTIDPRSDDRFRDQEWASKFNLCNLTAEAHLSPATIGEIIRFCDKISGLKAFW